MPERSLFNSPDCGRGPRACSGERPLFVSFFLRSPRQRLRSVFRFLLFRRIPIILTRYRRVTIHVHNAATLAGV